MSTTATAPKIPIGSDLDYQELEKLLDRTKSSVFKGGEYSAFFGALMSQLNFVWAEDIGTAAVDGVTFYWNPYWFLRLPVETRKTILMHELWHCAYIDMVRMQGRHGRVWNYACDIRINNMLEDLGYSFKGFERRWHDQRYRGQSAEEIYDDMMANSIQPPKGDAWGGSVLDEILQEIADKLGHDIEVTVEDYGSAYGEDVGEDEDDAQETGDLRPPPSLEDQQTAVNNAVGSGHAANSSGAGGVPGSVEICLKQFLAPIIPWEVMLHRFCSDLLDTDFDWRTRDRRFQDVYLPGEFEDEGLLDHLLFVEDVSGSISDAQNVRFNSEVRFIKVTMKPKKLTLLQFDTVIQDVQVFGEEDPFEEIIIKGRGGTDLTCVRDYIIEHKPTAVVVFSDLFCAPMERLPVDIPVLWVAISNKDAEVNFGELIHIKG